MIVETPDKLNVSGKVLPWYDGKTFFMFKSAGGNVNIIISYGRGADFVLEVNGKNLTDYVKKVAPDFAVHLDHENLANLIHTLNPKSLKADMQRKDFLISGRSWEVGGKCYISLWNDKSTLEKNKSKLDELLKYLKTDYNSTLFELPGNQNNYLPYDKIPSKSASAGGMEKFMAQIHTLPPGAKKWAMKGMSLKEILIQEDPDDIYIDDENGDTSEFNWQDEETTSVFSIFNNKLDNGKTEYIIALTDGGYPTEIFTSSDYLNKKLSLSEKDPEDDIWHARITHDYLLDPLIRSGYISRYDDYSRSNTEVSGRTWNIEGVNYVSVWHRLRDVINNKEHIDDILRKLGASPNNTKFETIDFPNVFKTYDEVFKRKSKASSLTPKQIKLLMQKQHLDPRAKKILLTLRSGDKYRSVLQATADDMGIPLAKLRNIMVTGD